VDVGQEILDAQINFLLIAQNPQEWIDREVIIHLDVDTISKRGAKKKKWNTRCTDKGVGILNELGGHLHSGVIDMCGVSN
jgi:hypothetical protein